MNTGSIKMYIITCLDDNNGIAFNHRRQTKDRVVIEDIQKTVGEKNFWMTEYSVKLFDSMSNIKICEKPEKQAKKGEYVFLELEAIDTSDEQIEQLIIYRWNRVYPADVTAYIGDEWKLAQSLDFAGFSHEKITKEIYRREFEGVNA